MLAFFIINIVGNISLSSSIPRGKHWNTLVFVEKAFKKHYIKALCIKVLYRSISIYIYGMKYFITVKHAVAVSFSTKTGFP